MSIQTETSSIYSYICDYYVTSKMKITHAKAVNDLYLPDAFHTHTRVSTYDTKHVCTLGHERVVISNTADIHVMR